MDAWADKWINKGMKDRRERKPSTSVLGAKHPLRRKEDKRQREALRLPTSFVYWTNLS